MLHSLDFPKTVLYYVTLVSQHFQSLYPLFPECRHLYGLESSEEVTDVLQGEDGWLSVWYIRIQ